jgi:peptidyl-prolyl cis-trans isomerase C
MSPPGRPKRESFERQRKGSVTNPPGRPKGESLSAQREGSPVTSAVDPQTAAARVNGVALADPGEVVAPAELRQRACTELLRQAAIREGLLAADDPPPVAGATSEAATVAIEALLDRALAVPEPDENACRRHYAAHAARYALGERARLRHVLFAVTPGVDLEALRSRAEACLIDLRARGRDEAVGADDRFAAAARELSNCPSGAAGGALGWLTAADCAPEFAREVFGQAAVGVLPRLARSRFGLHVIEVLERQAGASPPFEQVRAAVAQSLRQQAFATALRQYLQVLAGEAQLSGVSLDQVDTPLVQ